LRVTLSVCAGAALGFVACLVIRNVRHRAFSVLSSET
jgi:hypothetical protein